MKKLMCTLLGVIFILLCSCNTNEIEDLESDVRALNDSLSLVQAEQNRLLDSISKLVEACVVSHYRRYYETMYIKAKGEVDIAYIDRKKFWPVSRYHRISRSIFHA